MSVTLVLHTDPEECITPYLDGQPLAGRTPKASLPTLERLQADPYELGKQLTAALGGQALLKRLEADAEGVLLLQADAAADLVPWEFATLPDRRLLAVRFSLLRLIDRDAPPAPAAGPLRFIALGADPLVDEKGRPCEGYRLAIESELREIRRVLEESGQALQAFRVPPTREALRRALQRGPAILHLTCHGDVIDTPDGPAAVLLIEDADGKEDRLLGQHLMDMPPRGVLRFVLLSACHTSVGDEARLARALVLNGVPAAIGMQGKFPDPQSDDLAVALYETLLMGHPLAEAVRGARQALGQHPYAAGLPVCYVARNAWGPLPLQAGQPVVSGLGLPGQAHLPQEVRAPERLLGRDLELHQLARLYSQGRKVVTVAGTGGVGKTALAAAFARRFAWRWPKGAWAVSFASGTVDDARFRADLVRLLRGEAEAQRLAERPDEQAQVILDAIRDWDGLLVLDNYESVLQAQAASDPAALAVHRLVFQMAEAGAALLLTSREQPAHLPGEVLFPDPDRPLPGLRVDPAAQLFLHHSARAKAQGAPGLALALAIAQAAEGHPLAIALLAGEYDTSTTCGADEFLANWGEELAAAEHAGLAGHQRTFATAFARSYDVLPAELQARLRALSVFPFPFFAEGAALVWERLLPPSPPAAGGEGGQGDEGWTREILGQFVRRNLLEVDGRFTDGTPATYRFQPALLQQIARLVKKDERAAHRTGYAAYGAWLARRGYGDIHRDVGLARVVRLSLDALDAATATLTGTERLWHVRRQAWLKNAYGETRAAYDAIMGVLAPDSPLPDPHADPEAAKADSSLRYELANLCVTRGELDRALVLYQESLKLDEQLGDLKGKAASLHNMAQVYVTRGDLDRALVLYQESLKLDEQLGDLQGKAASLSMMAQVYVTRGDLDRALLLYQESLKLLEHLGDLKGKAASLAGLANVYMARQEWDKATEAINESLSIARRLGQTETIAFNTIYLGQVAQARGDCEGALARYREGLAIFERLGMPRETAQVRQLIASLEGGAGVSASNPLGQAIAQARTAAQRGDMDAAIAAQEQAVALVRAAISPLPPAGELGERAREALVQLSVLLYNLAGYYSQADRHEDAVRALEEVVALDERTGHPDLESDRQTLQAARAAAAMSPEERALLQAAAQTAASQQQTLEAQLAALPPEQRAQLEAAARELADQARDAAIAARRGQAEREPLIARLQEVAAQAAEGEAPGSAWDELAAFLRAVIAVLKGEAVPPVPAAYAGHLAAIQAA